MNERDIFLSAIEITDPGERAAFVKQACGADADLLNQVEELLKSHEQTSQFLETPAAAADSAIEQTVLSDDFEGDNDSERSNGEEEFRRYLQPTTRPGWLGRLAHYEIEEIIGRGAFGIVAKAFDEKLHRVVAIKLMNPELAATSPPRKRFLREARTAAAVSHENIVAIHSVEEDPIPYLVMEYIPGQTLQQRLNEQGPLDLNDILEIGRQIAAGLAAAHAVNLIHRDIKPSNILLTDGPNERVKISDFGLARAVDDASLTSSGLIAGTPMYMAPEQARGETLDHRADLFSLGSVLYQMTSGRPPFRAGNTVAVLKRVCDDAPRPISDIIGGTPEWLSSIISRLMEKDRENRFQSAQEVADLLAACRRDLDQDRKPTPVIGAAVSTSGRAKQRNNATQTAPKGVILGMLMTLAAFIFVTVISPKLARWLDTPIPRLPQVEKVGGLRFDGRDDWVEVTGLDWNYPQFTIEAFVTSAAGSDNGTIAFLGSGKGDEGEWMSLFDGGQAAGGKRISGAAIKGRTAYENAYGPFTANERQHRALVFDGRHLHYYINGIWQGERRAEPHEGLEWRMRKLHIGCDGGGRKFFQGVIDQLKISRVAKYSQNFEVTSDFESDEQTLALYRFDENEGELLKDFSGNGHDGKIIGAKWVPVEGTSAALNEEPANVVTTNPEGWIELFNGKNLDGWEPDDPAWTVKNGLLVTTGVNSESGGRLIYQRRKFDDVHIFAECKLGPNGNSGLVARTRNADGIFGGYEAQLTSPEARGKGDQNLYGMGSLYGFVPKDLNIPPGTWFTAELMIVGPNVTVRINGETTAEHRLDPNTPETDDSRYIALACLYSEQDIAFRRVVARDLSQYRNQPYSGGFNAPTSVQNATMTSAKSWHGWPADAPPGAIAPFNADQAKAHQEAWAKYLGVPVEYENSIGMKFRLIPPGEFVMGSTPEEIEAALKAVGENEAWRERINSEAPQHKVILTQPVYVGVTEVTQSQYEHVMGANPSHFSATGEGKDAVANLETGNHPVEMVSWNEAAEFCAKLSVQEQLKPFYFRSGETVTPLDGTGYRLPTEAEWESACRAGTTTRYWSGNEDQDLVSAGWFGSNSGGRTHAAGELKANPFGLWDVHGNVWEWVQDSWDPTFYGKFEDDAAINPSSPFPTGSQRVVRGGGWLDNPSYCRSSYRRGNHPSGRNYDFGFRVVLPVNAVK